MRLRASSPHASRPCGAMYGSGNLCRSLGCGCNPRRLRLQATVEVRLVPGCPPLSMTSTVAIPGLVPGRQPGRKARPDPLESLQFFRRPRHACVYLNSRRVCQGQAARVHVRAAASPAGQEVRAAVEPARPWPKYRSLPCGWHRHRPRKPLDAARYPRDAGECAAHAPGRKRAVAEC